MLDTYNRVSRATQTIIARTGREPSIEELEKETGVPRDKLDKVKDLYADTPFSLDRPVGDEDGRRFIDFLVEENMLSPYDSLANQKWAEEVQRLLGTLTPASTTRTSSRSRRSATSTTCRASASASSKSKPSVKSASKCANSERRSAGLGPRGATRPMREF
jgi:DNA-directed RNA polymerase sigma subunit (sigma70/sigma32)